MRIANIIIGLTAAASLTACVAPPPRPAAGPFDPAKDRERVKACLTRHFTLPQIGIEILHLPEEQVLAADKLTEARWKRLKPFAEAVDRLRAPGQEEIYGEAGYGSHTYKRYFQVQALIPGSQDRLFKEAVAQSEACDAVVRTWTLPPAAPSAP